MPWIKSYPEGVRWDIDIEPVPVQQILDDAAAKWPDRPALEFMGRRHQLSRAAASWSTAPPRACSSSASARACTSASTCRTRRTTSIAFFGVLKAGGTVVNYSPLDAAQVLEHKIEDSRDRRAGHARPRGALSADGGDCSARRA